MCATVPNAECTRGGLTVLRRHSDKISASVATIGWAWESRSVLRGNSCGAGSPKASPRQKAEYQSKKYPSSLRVTNDQRQFNRPGDAQDPEKSENKGQKIPNHFHKLPYRLVAQRSTPAVPRHWCCIRKHRNRGVRCVSWLSRFAITFEPLRASSKASCASMRVPCRGLVPGAIIGIGRDKTGSDNSSTVGR